MTPDSKVDLPMGVSPNTGYHRYAGRWIGGAADGKATYKDGALVARGNTTDAEAIKFQYRHVVNIGWFRWWSPVFVGDVREVIIFSGALSDGDLKRFDDSEKLGC